MSNTVQHKRNTSSGQAPSASDLSAGEIAINTADAKLFIKDSAHNPLIGFQTSKRTTYVQN